MLERVGLRSIWMVAPFEHHYSRYHCPRERRLRLLGGHGQLQDLLDHVRPNYPTLQMVCLDVMWLETWNLTQMSSFEVEDQWALWYRSAMKLFELAFGVVWLVRGDLVVQLHRLSLPELPSQE